MVYIINIDNQQEIVIHLEKVNKMDWWKNVLTHHPEIDTSKIEPENSKVKKIIESTQMLAW